MDETWIRWILLALAAGLGAATLFVGGSYLLALSVTRGRFGWPGLRYVLQETLLFTMTQALLPMGWLTSERLPSGSAVLNRDQPRTSRRPIVLVHGITQNRTNFFWLARMLRRSGLGPTFGFNYQSLGPIEASSQELGRFVERVLEATGAPEVDLICHSLGGLVARTYVDLLGGHARVRRVITLGSPHRGSALVDIRHVPIASLRDVHPQTGLIARLDAAPMPPPGRYHSIYSTHDNIVFPHVTSSLGERGTDVMVRRHGHFGILFSEEVAGHVRRALNLEEGVASAA